MCTCFYSVLGSPPSRVLYGLLNAPRPAWVGAEGDVADPIDTILELHFSGLIYSPLH